MSPLDPLELAGWKARYERAKMAFVGGVTSRIEAVDTLRNLRFRDEALRIELDVWTLEKVKLQKAKHAEARRKLKDYIYEPGTPTTPSSL
jgi:hypothetical protein